MATAVGTAHAIASGSDPEAALAEALGPCLSAMRLSIRRRITWIVSRIGCKLALVESAQKPQPEQIEIDMTLSVTTEALLAQVR